MTVHAPAGKVNPHAPFEGEGATQRATIQLGGSAEVLSEGGAGEFVNRIPIALPVTTKRWRLRARNYDSTANAVGTAPISITGIFIGKPKPYTTERWPGTFLAKPISALLPSAAFAMGLATDGISPWVEAPEAQIQAYLNYALSVATNRTAGGKTFYDPYGSAFFNGGTLAEAGEAAAPAPGAAQLNLCDMRLEYEYIVGSTNAQGVTNSGTLGLVIGDSHTCGYDGGDGGSYAMEYWVNQLALRRGHPIIHSGVAGATITASAASFLPVAANWKWERIKPFITTPSFAVIAHGEADAIQLKPLAEFQAAFAELVAALQATIGIPHVYACTLLPAELPEAEGETRRVEMNKWIRTVPCGLAGILEFDKQVALQATPSKVDPAYGAPTKANGHLLRGGYMRLAGAAAALP